MCAHVCVRVYMCVRLRGMTRLRTGFVGGIDEVKVPVTHWTINRQLDKCCAVFTKDFFIKKI